MNVLITGITGMIGSAFAKATRQRGWATVGIARSSASSRMEGVADPSVIRCDILDRDSLAGVFAKTKPDLVVHMAAQAYNGASWACENITHMSNYTGTLHVLQCVRDITPKAKVILACSSAEYGTVEPRECPLREERLLRPVSPYGVSKVGTECLGSQFASNFGMQVFLPRLFIHVGTGHPPATAIQNFARQLAYIARGIQAPKISVGNLETARDFIDVRDGVEGLIALAQKGKPNQPVNLCTGKAYKIGEILDMLIEISGLKVEVAHDVSLDRPSDEALLLGDNSRLLALGWTQQYTIRQTLQAVYEDWLGRVSPGTGKAGK